MKAVKINMKESSSMPVKALIMGVIVNAAVVLLGVLFLSLFSVIAGNLFRNAAEFLLLVPLALGGYCGGFCAGRISKEKGLLLGTLCGTVVLLGIIIAGFITESSITYMILLKALATILPSALGGIKGVNKKEKFKV